ncbi:MAG: hypothetical protein ABS54_10155 [Hyphomicrobium sp. SCN 65-11]|nr:MAG: hypothetical protein ABS54_10155 [Hyphomicrobium sp. SCN 65-11]
MARPLVKKNDKGVLTRPPGIEGKIDIALAQDWATLSRRTRETNPRSDDSCHRNAWFISFAMPSAVAMTASRAC